MEMIGIVPTELKWLVSRSTVPQSLTGYDATGWEDSIWILHAMYENANLPSDITYDDEARSDNPPVEAPPGACIAVLVGCPGGESRWPGPGWDRLFWKSLAE